MYHEDSMKSMVQSIIFMNLTIINIFYLVFKTTVSNFVKKIYISQLILVRGIINDEVII